MSEMSVLLKSKNPSTVKITDKKGTRSHVRQTVVDKIRQLLENDMQVTID